MLIKMILMQMKQHNTLEKYPTYIQPLEEHCIVKRFFNKNKTKKTLITYGSFTQEVNILINQT